MRSLRNLQQGVSYEDPPAKRATPVFAPSYFTYNGQSHELILVKGCPGRLSDLFNAMHTMNIKGLQQIAFN